ncbi:hypothetical protein J6590_005806 [Homalodisca vitripennis]|nr:hypothetical protein J6590_005806 [Homalodisca vitripennis]
MTWLSGIPGPGGMLVVKAPIGTDRHACYIVGLLGRRGGDLTTSSRTIPTVTVVHTVSGGVHPACFLCNNTFLKSDLNVSSLATQSLDCGSASESPALVLD